MIASHVDFSATAQNDPQGAGYIGRPDVVLAVVSNSLWRQVVAQVLKHLSTPTSVVTAFESSNEAGKII